MCTCGLYELGAEVGGGGCIGEHMFVGGQLPRVGWLRDGKQDVQPPHMGEVGGRRALAREVMRWCMKGGEMFACK